MTDQLPAVLQPGVLTTPADTYIVPTLIADAGDAAGWRVGALNAELRQVRRDRGELLGSDVQFESFLAHII